MKTIKKSFAYNNIGLFAKSNPSSVISQINPVVDVDMLSDPNLIEQIIFVFAFVFNDDNDDTHYEIPPPFSTIYYQIRFIKNELYFAKFDTI